MKRIKYLLFVLHYLLSCVFRYPCKEN